MAFKDEYTTADIISKEALELSLMDGKLLDDLMLSDKVLEADKIVLSNDFYMLGQQFECLLNKMVR